MTKSDQIRELLAKRPDLSNAEIARTVGVSKSMVTRVKTRPKSFGPALAGFEIETIVRERIIALGVSVPSLALASGVATNSIRIFKNGHGNLAVFSLFALAEALGLRFYVEYLDVNELPSKHPARRLHTPGHGGIKPRSVWGLSPRAAAISAYAATRSVDPGESEDAGPGAGM